MGRLTGFALINAITLGVLCGTYGGGLVLGLVGLTNTSCVFFVLWLVHKYGEFHREVGWNGWVLLLLLSLLAWRGALFLHVNPQYVSAFFSIKG
jgi:hypothetical protein